MVRLKLELNYPLEIGFGQLSGCCQNTKLMEFGHQVEKLISWKAEVTSDTQLQLVVVQKPSLQLYIGDLTSQPTNIKKPINLTLYQTVKLLPMISTFSVYTGQKMNYTLMLMIPQTNFWMLISRINLCGI
jgi:hypothetical protein